MPRLVIVSNRLPVTIKLDHGRLRILRSPGGLATGLAHPHEQMGGVWVGWPGDTGHLDAAQEAALNERFAQLRVVPVRLSAAEVAHYYEGFSNNVLWPLFHYLLDHIPPDTRDWRAFVRVNERFAEEAARVAEPGDLVWIHDYQLSLVPEALRRRRPDVKIGFFLHIPFPSAEVIRTLPWRRELLEGILGADLVGFHTRVYLNHFVESCRVMLGVEGSEERIRRPRGDIRLGVFPMGVDAASIGAIASSPSVVADAAALRGPALGNGEERLILGIDRLDYTKGIPRRVLAVERFLEKHPRMRGNVRFVQIAVPSRERLEAYRRLRKEVEELVGRINGMYGSSTSVPIHYVYRNLAERQVIAHYRAADVMVVTPLRDGMNLVAKEFVAARVDEDGVLVLSELAGAAEELHAALKVNPYDVTRMAETFRRALTMPAAERKARMKALRSVVLGYDVHTWARTFIEELGREEPASALPPPAPDAVEQIRARLADPLVVLLDYDGTLVDFAARPELAAPDPELLELLRSLGRRPKTEVHLVSGRKWQDLERWFGDLPIGLHAEHGLWMRPDPGRSWLRTDETAPVWMDVVGPAMEAAVARLPGAFIERKSASLAFHFRVASAPDREELLRDLRHQLHELGRWLPLDVLEGSAVLEARTRGVHKGRIALWLQEVGRLEGTALAIGDDHTDEDLFAALPPSAVTVLVGDRRTLARHRLPNPAAVRTLLRRIAASDAAVPAKALAPA
jgi:trehalose 6-phosphate synthase/phosphatase